ncbi:MAG: Ig-like domain-containing protein, partial [Muribaculaceae bacterium]|nr:Ig-like domain-containing protein [Muribaculaceae bacterium]
MKQKFLTTILLLLSIVAPFAVSAADSFKVKSVNLEPGNPEGVLEFVLVNEQAFYGFQADVKLPAGLTAVPNGSEGDLDITLSERASAGNFHVNSNTLADGTIRMGAFSQNLTPFSGNNGVLVSMKVSVAKDYKGGDVVVSKIYFIDSENKDVKLKNASTLLGVGVTKITLSKTEVELKVDGTESLTATVEPSTASDKTLTWTTSDPKVAIVDSKGNITAKGLGKAIITATCKCGHVSSSCTVDVIPTPVTGLKLLNAKLEPLSEGALIEIHTNDQYNFTAEVEPENATDKTVTWTTSDDTVIQFLDDEGLIKALKVGEATVTA